MVYNEFIPLFDFLGTIGFLIAVIFGIQNYRNTEVERPFWLVFTFTAALGSVWLALVTIEWLGVSSVVMDLFSTSLQAVVIGIFAVAVVGTFPLVQDLKESRIETIQHASLVSILSRVLRHNLRNDLTVIRGYATMLRNDSEKVEKIEEEIDDLIKTSEKTRKLEQAITSQPRRSPVNLYDFVARIGDEIIDEYPDVSIDITGPTDITAAIPQSLEIAIEELVENAAKHTGTEPEIEITIRETESRISIQIEDNGPGIPKNERILLDEDIETSLLHSNGVGLWLSQWIVANQEGEISAENVENGAVVKITIPDEMDATTHDHVQAEANVYQGYDRYNAIFENDVDGILIVNDSHRILDANKRAGDLFDTTPTELLGQSLDHMTSNEFEFQQSLSEYNRGEITNGTICLPTDTEDATEAMWVAQSDIVIGEHLVAIREITPQTDLI